MTEFQASEPRSWVRIWAAVTVGGLLGSFIVPALSHKFGDSSPWADAFAYGWEKLWSIGIPTAAMYTVVLGLIVLSIFYAKRKKR